MIYYLISILLLLIALLRKSPIRQISTVGVLLLILIMGGLRFEVGTDWFSYLDIYDSMSPGYSADEYREETGFLWLVVAFKLIGASYSQFIFGIFLLSFSIKVVVAQRLKADLPVVLCVYFYSIFLIYDVNGLRQGLAMSLIFLSSTYVIRNQWFRFIATVLIASLIHTAAIAALALYFMAKFTWLAHQNTSRKVLLIVVSIIIGLIISRALGGIDLGVGLNAIEILSRYSYYIGNDDYQEVFNFLSFATLQRLFVALLLVFSYDQINVEAKEKSLLLNIYIFSVFLYFCLSFNMEIMARASFYFKGFDIFILGLIYASAKTTLERHLLFGMLVLFTTGSIYRLLSIPDGMLIPYRSVLSFL